MEVKTIKAKTSIGTLIAAITILLLGVVLIFASDAIVEVLLIAFAVVILMVFGISKLASSIQEKKMSDGVMVFISSLSAAGLLLYVDFSLDTVAIVPSIVVGAVSLLVGIMRLLICINCIANRYKGAIRNGISAVVCIIFGLFLVIHPISNFSFLSIVAGVYLFIYSVTMFGDFFAVLFHSDLNEDKIKRRNHRALPNLINAVKPNNMINQINKDIASGKVKSGVIVEEKTNTPFNEVNAEIMVHLTTQGANKFGHVDLALNDKIYSYGTYDSSADRMGGFVSQGTFIIVPKNEYLKYCLNVQQKYVIGFGASLSQKQFNAVEKKINELLSDCEPFESKYEAALKKGEDASELHDPASNIVRDVGGKVYTVTKGPFRRYFGINTNCVHVADWLLSESGIDAISFSSIRTPGSYYAMLQNMFRRKNTRVIRKTTYIIADDIK